METKVDRISTEQQRQGV